MTPLSRVGIPIVFALCIAGCATRPPSTVATATVTPVRTKLLPAHRVKDAVTIGKSTKAEVIASLGETLAIGFDSGFEVWVYRLVEDTPAKAAPAQRITRSGSKKVAPEELAEFVILFAPSGLVAKTRIRPAPQPSHEG